MRKVGLAMFIVGFVLWIGQGFIAEGFLIPLMKTVYPNLPPNNIASGSGIAIEVTGISMIIGGVVIFLIYRKQKK